MLGLERSAQFARVAAGRGLAAVVSSSFESAVGLSILARLAAAFNVHDIAAGLDTGGCFRSNLSPSLPIVAGRIDLSKLADISREIDRRLLTEIARA
jgi:O-succinylbenzoate synthase